MRGSTTTSPSPWMTSVGAVSDAEPVVRVEGRARRRLRRPRLEALRRREPGARGSARRAPAADPARARSRRTRAASRAPRIRSHGLLAASGTPAGPPGVVQTRTSFSTRSGAAERELLRDHPAEARPDDVRALDAGLVEHLQRVAGHLRRRVRAGRRVALADPAVVEQDHVERARERLHHRLPAPARVAEPVDQQQRRPRARVAPRRSSSRLPPARRCAAAGAAAAGEAREPAGNEEDEQDEDRPEDEERLRERLLEHGGQLLDRARSRRASRAAGRRACRGSRRAARRSACPHRRSRPSRAASA